MKEQENVTKRLYPVEEVELASKGKCYKEDNPLSSGKIEMHYLTAKEEDILSNQNFIKKEIVLDKLFQSMIESEINYDDLLIADKDGIMVAARILSYGKDYEVNVQCPGCETPPQKVVIDLSELKDKGIDYSLLNEQNEYEVSLPVCKKTITFKLLTVGDEKAIKQELNMHKAVSEKTGIKVQAPDVSTRLKHLIVAIDGNRDPNVIRKFVDEGELLAADSFALRKELKRISPGIDLTYTFQCNNEECGHTAVLSIPMEASFFWPDAAVQD